MDEQKYVIFYKCDDGSCEYVYEINRSNIYTTSDLQQAMFIGDKDQALAMAAYCRARNKKSYKVLAVVTTTSVVEEE